MLFNFSPIDISITLAGVNRSIQRHIDINYDANAFSVEIPAAYFAVISAARAGESARTRTRIKYTVECHFVAQIRL